MSAHRLLRRGRFAVGLGALPSWRGVESRGSAPIWFMWQEVRIETPKARVPSAGAQPIEEIRDTLEQALGRRGPQPAPRLDKFAPLPVGKPSASAPPPLAAEALKRAGSAPERRKQPRGRKDRTEPPAEESSLALGRVGRVFFRPPNRMRTHETQTIAVRIVRNVFAGPRPGATGKTVPPVGGEVPMGSTVGVRLYGDPDDFAISGRSEAAQILDFRRSSAEWIFAVKPLRSGWHELDLSIGSTTVTSAGAVIVDALNPGPIRLKVHVNTGRAALRTAQTIGGIAAVVLITYGLAANAVPLAGLIGGIFAQPEADSPAVALAPAVETPTRVETSAPVAETEIPPAVEVAAPEPEPPAAQVEAPPPKPEPAAPEPEPAVADPVPVAAEPTPAAVEPVATEPAPAPAQEFSWPPKAPAQ